MTDDTAGLLRGYQDEVERLTALCMRSNAQVAGLIEQVEHLLSVNGDLCRDLARALGLPAREIH